MGNLPAAADSGDYDSGWGRNLPLLWLAVFTFTFYSVVAGCSEKRMKSELSPKEAVELAENEVVEREAWEKSHLESEIDSLPVGYVVIVWRLPKAPGSFRRIEISNEGEVIGYHRGK